jgi:hypothetical protein
LLLGPRGGDVVWIAIAGGSVVDQVVERPTALDVHKEQVTACVRTPGEGGQRRQEVREFKTTVRGLLALRDWLAALAGDDGCDGGGGRVLAAGVGGVGGRV